MALNSKCIHILFTINSPIFLISYTILCSRGSRTQDFELEEETSQLGENVQSSYEVGKEASLNDMGHNCPIFHPRIPKASSEIGQLLNPERYPHFMFP